MECRVVIIDDEKKAVETIRIIIEEYISSCQVVGVAYSASEGAKVINQTQPDLVLLDIEMPNSSGFDMLEMIPEKNFETIFITAYDQYAIKAIKFSAFDYLLKPISIISLKDAIESYINEKEQRDKKRYDILYNAVNQYIPVKIALNYLKGIRYISLEDILYISSDRSYTTVFIADGEEIVLSNKSLNEFEALLEPEFFRIHRSYLVNMNHVVKFSNVDGGVVVISNSDELFLSRRKKEQFLEAMNKKIRS